MGLIGFVAEIIVLGCLAGGLACNIYVVTSCNMLELGGGIGNIGPWRLEIRGQTDGCEGWDKADANWDDALVNMARACSMMALCFGGIFSFFFFFIQCLCPLPCGQKLMDIAGTGCNISLALIWFMIRSDICDELRCSWGSGATALLVNHVFYLGASIFTRCMREPRYKRRKDDDDDDRRIKQDDTNDNNFEEEPAGGA